MGQWNELPDLDKDNYVPLYVQLGNILENYIRGNGLGEGQLVPSENDLTARYRISRNTVRQAFQILESQDVIRRIRGRGTFVAAPRRRQSLTGLKIIETRLRELGVRVTNQPIWIRETFPPRDWGRLLGLGPREKAVMIRRVKTADDLPFALEERVFPVEVARNFTEDDLKYRSVNVLTDELPDCKVMNVVYSLTSTPLTSAEAKDLNATRSDPVVRRVGLYKNIRGEPVMFGRLTFLSDRIELRFEFVRCEDENWMAIVMS